MVCVDAASWLQKHGFQQVTIPGGYGVVDPHDDEDGFALFCQDEEQCIRLSYEHLKEINNEN